MSHYKLALLGFGNVGKAFAELLLRKQDELLARYDLTFSVTAIATGSHGSVIDLNGIDLKKALTMLDAGGSLNELSASPSPSDRREFIAATGADVLFEITPVSYEDGQPALDHIRTALENGMHAVTANKGPVVHGYRELKQLAAQKGRKFYFESAVMDGAPVFAIFRETLPAAQVRAFKGILNSTTNLILTRMESGESFADAVAYAQSVGIAETDPSGDVDGWDAAIKVAALVTVMMDTPLKPDEVDRTGIRDLTPEQMADARAEGKRWKLVCSAKKEKGQVSARVAPELVDPETPFYTVEGTTSILEVQTDVLGDLSIIETDPGPHTTAYGLLADFLNAVINLH
ncbi:MAG: homoserine dehydrogenase [Anaerolineales bacterium]